jgi:hypothetical protein
MHERHHRIKLGTKSCGDCDWLCGIYGEQGRTFVPEPLHLSVQVEYSGHERRDLALWNDKSLLHTDLQYSASYISS